MESLIGPFQSSPFSIIPKPGRPNNFCILQNYSFPHNISNTFPNHSINSSINSDDFPTTWGTFTVISLLIHQLPPNSQVGTRDVAEAYRTIPLHHSQWPGAVARIGDNAFCIDTSTCFGVSLSSGVYGSLADAGTDLFCSHRIGPLAKWVNNHIFFRILLKYLPIYNHQCTKQYTNLTAQGQRQDGGRLWYSGTTFPDGTLDEHVKNCQFPCLDLSTHTPQINNIPTTSTTSTNSPTLSEFLGNIPKTCCSHHLQSTSDFNGICNISQFLSPFKRSCGLHFC